MSLSATLFGRDSFIHKATNILGLGIPGWLDKKFGAPETEGPRLDDLSVQTSTYGTDIPRLYGTIAGAGNLIQLENNKLKEKVRKKKSGGKGGGGSSETTTTYSYSATFQLALCEGPIAGVRRIWCGDKLIYNAGSNDLDTIIASNQAAKGWRLYRGTDDQLPDPRYEAEYGVGNVSAHRGLAYIAFYDFQLADYSNTLQGSQFKVEVAHSDEEFVSSGSDSLPALGVWSGIAKNSSLSIAVADGSSMAASAFDGRTWRPLTLPLASSWKSIVWADSYFCTISAAGISLVSPDGANWNSAALPRVVPWRAMAWGGGKLCAVAYGSQYTATSVDGLEWVEGALPASRNWVSVTWGNGVFLAVAAGTNICATSADGLTWVEHALPMATDWIGAVWNGQVFCLASSIASASLLVSVDGSAWEQVVNPEPSVIWSAITASNERFFLVSRSSGGTSKLSSSVDGRNWIVASVPSENWAALTAEGNVVYGVAPGVISLYAYIRIGSVSASLAGIVTDECALSSLIGAADVDVSSLTTGVRGYRVSGGSIRSALEPLQVAYPFDVIQSGYRLKCVPRGQASVATIPWQDLGASDGDKPGELLQESREMDSQLPARTSIKYMDAAREYAIAEQHSDRLNTPAVNRVDHELPLVLIADEAAGIAEVLNFLPWLERSEYAFSLPPSYLALEPGDVTTVTATMATLELRLTDVSYSPSGRLECTAKPSRAALYTSSATGAEGVPPAGTIPLPGPALFLPLDIPTIDETVQNASGFVGLMTGPLPSWDSGLLVRSADGGQTWQDVQAFVGRPSVGTAQGVLPASSCTIIDQRSIVVDLLSGELESVTRDQMLAGHNYAAYGADGRWEIVRFQNAVLQGDGSYLVSGFVRGDHGTEWASGLHVAGDYFILLDDPDNAFIGMAVGSISVPATYRGITSGESLDSASDVAFTYQGVNLECLSPVHARGVRDGAGNFSGSFTRRSRLSSSWWTTGVPAPLGETGEAYEIDVMSGSTVKRTLTAASPAFSYSAADQSADFGSAQAAITFRIFQLSGVVGRGYSLEVTL